MPIGVTKHVLYLAFYTIVLFLIFWTLLIGSVMMHAAHQEYWLKEGPWRSVYNQLRDVRDEIASIAVSDEISYYEGHLKAYPDASPDQRKEWQSRITEIRRQRYLLLVTTIGGLVASYAGVYATLRGLNRLRQIDRLGIFRLIPRVLVTFVAWLILAWVVTVLAVHIIPAITNERYDPFNVRPPLEETASYWQSRAEGAIRPSAEWDTAVRRLNEIRQETVHRWITWFGVVTTLYIMGSGVVWSLRRQHRKPTP